MHIDFGHHNADLSTLNEKFDVCIVGTGPAGSTLASELANTNLRVIVIESGHRERREDADALNEIENVGWPRVSNQWEVRNRIVGGSSHTWGGRCAPFDEIDFEHRDWVPMSGWPLAQKDLSDYLDRSAKHLGLNAGRGFNDENFWTFANLKAPAFSPDPSKLLPFFWQFSRDRHSRHDYMRFGKHLFADVSGRVTLITGATVVRIEVSESGDAVEGVVCASAGQENTKILARNVVLCAGGIENPRLLLTSNQIAPAGLGNRFDNVGRYLMDHPRGHVGSFAIEDSEIIQNAIGRYNVRGNLFRGGFRLSPEVQRQEHLLNCSAWLGEWVAPDDPWEVVKRIIRRQPTSLADINALIRNRGLFARGSYNYFRSGSGIARKLEMLHLDCMCEQRPERDSRIMLSDKKDRFGLPTVRIDWRLHPDESRSMRRMAQLVKLEFERMKLPPLTLEEWVVNGEHFPPTFIDVAHPTGATRMSDTPATGVVDPNCQVFGVRGLYVSGSSVFPTDGHCNPTQMIVALAIRLADHLRVSAGRSLASAESRSGAEVDLRPHVLVTGGTGLIGRHVVSDLLHLGYRVRATTSRRANIPKQPQDGVEWSYFDLYEGGDYDALLADCSAVMHIAAEMKDHSRMERTNVTGTRDLVQAAERAGVKAFCYTSSISVYGSGLRPITGEEAPVLTPDRDVKSEYWGDSGIRTYGRCKLGGELAIRQGAQRARYVIMRPAVAVDIANIINFREWPLSKRLFAAHRHSHHVFVRDVSSALIWAMERGLRGVGNPGSVEIYNLAEDETPAPRHIQFMRRAYKVTRDPRFLPIWTPWFFDWTRDFLKNRTLPLRNPLWRMRFPNDKLRAAGFQFPFGMTFAYSVALQRLGSERGLRSARDAVMERRSSEA